MTKLPLFTTKFKLIKQGIYFLNFISNYFNIYKNTILKIFIYIFK